MLIGTLVVLAVLVVAVALSSEGDAGDDEVSSIESEDSATTSTRPSTTTSVDPEVLRVEMEAAISAACSAAASAPLSESDSDAAYEASDYESRFAPLATGAEFFKAVEACAKPHRDGRRAAECSGTPPVELVNRDPESFAGQCFTFVLSITQFDQGTGPCSFRARFDARSYEYSHEFKGENALVTFERPCPQLDPIGVDDIVRTPAVVVGGLQYDTTIGGTANAVALKPIGSVELIEDNN